MSDHEMALSKDRSTSIDFCNFSMGPLTTVANRLKVCYESRRQDETVPVWATDRCSRWLNILWHGAVLVTIG